MTCAESRRARRGPLVAAVLKMLNTLDSDRLLYLLQEAARLREGTNLDELQWRASTVVDLNEVVH